MAPWDGVLSDVGVRPGPTTSERSSNSLLGSVIPQPSGGVMPDPITVLVAEDEVILREALVDLINDEPDLTVAGDRGDAPGAIAVAAAVRPDVALVDVRMPGGGGPAA